jgi:AcrR family transcriptional regulator
VSGQFINSRERQEQRERERERESLRLAFVQAMADGGYGAITIARVSKLSGCTSETFHRHYEDLSACYRDACSHSLEQSCSATVAAWLEVRGWSERLRQSCNALLAHVEEHPDAARAVLCGLIAGGPDAAAHVRELTVHYERALAMGLQLHPQSFPTSRLTPRALTGGMRHAVCRMLQQGREGELVALADDLHDWIECHRSVAAARLPIERDVPASKDAPSAAAPVSKDAPSAAAPVSKDAPSTAAPQSKDAPSAAAPAGPAAAPAAAPGSAGERGDILAAVAQLMLRSDREALDDATVARHAGISVARFEAECGGVVACVTGLVDELIEGNAAALRAGRAQGGAWPESVRTALAAGMRHLQANLGPARLCLLRLPLLPEVAVARHVALADRIVSVAMEDAPAPIHAQGLMTDALAGVVDELLIWALSAAPRRRPARLAALADHISFFLLSPYLGGEAAAEAVIAAADAELLRRGPDAG